MLFRIRFLSFITCAINHVHGSKVLNLSHNFVCLFIFLFQWLEFWSNKCNGSVWNRHWTWTRQERRCVFSFFALVPCHLVFHHEKPEAVSVVLPLTFAHYTYEETSLIIYLETICESSGYVMDNKKQLYFMLKWWFTFSESRITKVVRKLVNMEEDKVTIYFIPYFVYRWLS